jgi:flagellin
VKIQSNTAALAAQRNLGASDGVLGKSIGKLSSGYRLNKASDDAAGMGIANKIRADLKALAQASRNASQATALVQVAEGAVGTISNILDRMKELATQSASDSVTDTDRVKIDAEYSALQLEVTRITDNTKYQGQVLLKGTYGVNVASASTIYGVAGVSAGDVTLSNAQASTTYTLTHTSTGAGVGTLTLTAAISGSGTVAQTVVSAAAGAQSFNFNKLGVKIDVDSGYATTGALTGLTVVTSAAAGGTFQVGTDANADSQISLTLGNLTLSGMGIAAALGTSITTAQTALSAIDTAIGNLNTVIGTIGAASNRFDYAMQNLQSIMENMGAAESVIRDADVGQEMTTFTKAQILQQAGTAMLAQANSAPQSVLSLLKG